MDGVGITMEAIGQNYVMYEAMLENKWRSNPISADQWLVDYLQRRYGEKVGQAAEVKDAWAIMREVIYDAPTHNVSYIESRPQLRDLAGGEPVLVDPMNNVVKGKVAYGALGDLWKAWRLLLSPSVASLGAGAVDPFNHDVVDLGTFVLTNEFTLRLTRFSRAVYFGDLSSVKEYGSQMLALIQDMDKLLATDNYYLLGKWISDARALAAAYDDDVSLYEFNARNQLTLWGPNGNINDYARKSWQGLYSDYYYSRWSLFIQNVIDCVSSGKHFNQRVFNVLLFMHENWQNSKTSYPSTGTGNTLKVANTLAKKYGY